MVKGASISQIAAAAGVSKGTLYNCFEGKHALLEAFIEKCCEWVAQQIASGDPEYDDAALGLVRIGREMLRIMISSDGEAACRVSVMEVAKFPELPEAFLNAGPNLMIDRMLVVATDRFRQFEST